MPLDSTAVLAYDYLHEKPMASRAEKGPEDPLTPLAISDRMSLRSDTAMTNEEILKVLRELVAEQFAKDPEDITMDTAFEGDLGADSVDLVELVMAMEEEFEVGEIQEEDLSGLKTVGDAVNYLAAVLNK